MKFLFIYAFSLLSIRAENIQGKLKLYSSIKKTLRTNYLNLDYMLKGVC